MGENNITREDLERVANRLLAFLEREQISSLKDLEARLDRSFPIEKTSEFIKIQKTPAGRQSVIPDSYAHTVSYIMPGRGIVIELRVNPTRDYSSVIIKVKDLVQGYHPFAVDFYGNIPQVKNIESTEIAKLTEELKALKGN